MPVSATPETSTTWKLDAAHSLVEFAVRHLMISTVKGRFGEVRGTVVTGDENFSDAAVDITIDTASIDAPARPRRPPEVG